MSIRWKQLIFKTTLWMVAEIVLTSIGMDDMADYCEYHFSYKQGHQVVLTAFI